MDASWTLPWCPDEESEAHNCWKRKIGARRFLRDGIWLGRVDYSPTESDGPSLYSEEFIVAVMLRALPLTNSPNLEALSMTAKSNRIIPATKNCILPHLHTLKLLPNDTWNQ